MKRFAMIVVAVAVLASGLQAQDAARLFKTAMHTEMVDGNLKAAIEQYKKVAEGPDRALAAQALLRIAGCYQKLGDPQARPVFERVVREFSDQAEPVRLARMALGRSAGPQFEPEVRLRRVMEGAFQGRVSPDGRYLTHNNRGRADALILRYLSTGTERALENGDLILDSTFSPDSTQVAYGACTVSNRTVSACQIRVVSLNRPGEPTIRRLMTATDDAYVGPVDWSPDGRTIAVYIQRQADRVLQFGLVNAADGKLRVLKTVDWGGTIRAFFSPDGRDVAIDLRSSEDSGKRDIYLMAVDASRETPVVTNPGEDFPLGWTPDGRHLLFGSDRTGAIGLWAQAITNRAPYGPPELVKANLGTDVRPVGTTQSGALYLGLRSFSQDIEVASVNLETASETARPTRPIRSVADRHYQPAWSPDGKSLAYVSERRGENILGILLGNPAIERELPLGSKLDRVSGLTWAADGRSFVAWGRDLKGRYGQFRIDATDGSVTAIEFRDPAGNGVEGFSWSPDGTKMYFRHSGSIHEREIASGRERIVASGAAPTTGPNANLDMRFGPMSVSPDGQWIATSRADGAAGSSVLMLIPVAGGAPRELLRVDRPQAFDLTVEAPRWTPDGRAVLVMKTLEGRAHELWLVPADGSKARKMELDVKRMASTLQLVRLHPDGRQLAYLVGETRAEIWALENFLPLKPAQP